MTKKNEPLNTRVTRLQMSRYEREQRQRRFIILGSIIVGVLTVLLIAAAVVQVFVIEPQRTAASVAGQPITVQQLQKRMRYDQAQLLNRFNQVSQDISQIQQGGDPNSQFLLQFYQQQLQQLVAQSSADQIAQNALDSMIDNQLIRQEAARRGITISPEDVTKELETSFGLYRETLTPFPTDTPAPPSATPIPVTATVSVTATRVATEAVPTTVLTPTATVIEPTATPRLQPTSITEGDYKLLLQRTIEGYQPLGITEQDLRALVEGNLYREKVQEAFAEETPKNAPHYKFDFVRFNTITDTQTAANRLTSNQIDFAALISETNAITQPAPIGNGLSVDWTSQQSVESQYGKEVADQLATAAIGAPTPIITSTTGGFYILLPLGREERALEESELQSERQRLFSEWLNKARGDAAVVQRLIDPTTVVPQQVRDSANNFLAQYGGGAQP